MLESEQGEKNKMKLKISKKDMKGEEIYRVGYCDLQHLLRCEEPVAYSSDTYGWACDYYKIEDAYICTGYSPIGKQVDYKLIKKYDAKAEKIISIYYGDYKKEKAMLTRLLKKFVAEITKE